MRVSILGRHWTLKFERMPKDTNGDCSDPNSPNKTIRVDHRLQGKDRLDTLLHEALHAADWHRDEDSVARFAEDFATIAYRLGFRWIDE